MNKLPRTLYTLISDWDQENVDVSRQDGTVTLQVTLDDSYESIWESERFLSLELTLIVDAETYQIEGYTWKYRFSPKSGYCDTYEEVAQSIDLGIDFTVPPGVYGDNNRGKSGQIQLYEMTSTDGP